MEILKNIKFDRKIQFAAIPLLVIFLVISAIAISNIYKKNVLKTTQHQAEVYIDKLAQLIDIVELQSKQGFSNNDYQSIKPFFQSPAYFDTDYPFLATRNGTYLVHILREGQMLPLEIAKVFKNNKNKQGTIDYEDFENNKTEKRILYYKYYEPYKAYIAISVSPKEAVLHSTNYRAWLIIIVVFFIIITTLGINLVVKPLAKRIKLIKENLNKLSLGIVPDKIEQNTFDEIGSIIGALNTYTESIKTTTEFANKIGNNDLTSDYQLLSENDSLGNALLNLRSSLIHNQEEEDKRKKEDEIRAWNNVGLAKFADILRQNNNDLTILGDNIIQNLVNYLDANQGGIFLFNETGEDKTLDLLSAFAYDRKKFLQKSISLGEGLVGTCALEKQTIYLKEIPSDYIYITSGLGEATPSCLLVIPLKLEETIFGVLEIASFHQFLPHEIEFVEKVGISIASTLSSAQNNIRTKFLLEQSQQQREEMSAQEEEMRQNMEEMQATQEEMSRKQVELEGITNAINQGLVFMLLNDEGIIVESNVNSLSLLELTKLEVEGNSLFDFVANDQKSEIKQLWENVRNGEQTESTLHLKGNNNKDIFMQTTISPGIDELGCIIKIFLIGKDITASKSLEIQAQKQAEEIAKNLETIKTAHQQEAEQKQDKQELLSALDQYCLITVIDPSGLILYINNKNVETLGDAKAEIEGKYLQDIDYTAKNQPDKFNLMWNNILSGKSQQRDFSLNVNNKTVWIRENFTPIFDSNGSLAKIFNIGIDITQAKEQELELAKLRDDIKKLKNKQNG